MSLLAEAGDEGKVLAGGTDLLVNLKHGITSARLLVSLREVGNLMGIHVADDGTLVVAAGETLADVAASKLVRTRAPALAQAAAAAAHPQARNMGTLGGNVCLDVRCRYVNRSGFWRGALGGCLKADGELCHVVPKGRNCMAAMSADTVAPLSALGAVLEVAGPGGTRRLPVLALRGKDGRDPVALSPGEIVTAIRVPPMDARRRSSYQKWAVRRAVDFPLVSLGMVLDSHPDGRVAAMSIVVGALGPRPKRITGLEAFTDEALTPELIDAVAERVVKQCAPLPNVLYDADYRRRRLGVMVKRQLEAWGR